MVNDDLIISLLNLNRDTIKEINVLEDNGTLENAEIAIDLFHIVKNLTKGFYALRMSIQKQAIYNSPVYYLLKNWHKLLDTDYYLDNESKYNSFFQQKLNYRDIYNTLLAINPDLSLAYELKKMYRAFNKNAKASDCKKRFDYIINIFNEANLPCYENFVITLNNWRNEILNSFSRPFDTESKPML